MSAPLFIAHPSNTKAIMLTHLYVAECDVGRGLFAGETIRAGTPILQFTGEGLTLAQVRAKGAAAANSLQVGVNEYVDLEEPGRLVNHSCDPNAVIKVDLELVALRDIARGEEIRFDYSTTISDGWTMECRCGAPQCRGLVTAFQLLPEGLRQRYALLGHVQRFLVEDIGA